MMMSTMYATTSYYMYYGYSTTSYSTMYAMTIATSTPGKFAVGGSGPVLPLLFVCILYKLLFFLFYFILFYNFILLR